MSRVATPDKEVTVCHPEGAFFATEGSLKLSWRCFSLFTMKPGSDGRMNAGLKE